MTEILTVSSLTLTLKSILDILSANGELKYETVKRQSGWEGGGGGGASTLWLLIVTQCCLLVPLKYLCSKQC